MRKAGLENVLGKPRFLGFFKKTLKTSKVQNLGFLGFLFCGEILHKSYLVSYFNCDW